MVTGTRDVSKNAAKYHIVVKHVLRLAVATLNTCSELYVAGRGVSKNLKMHFRPLVFYLKMLNSSLTSA